MTRLAKLKLTSDLTDQMSGLSGGAVSRVSAATYVDANGVLRTAWGNRAQLIDTGAQNDLTTGWWTLTRAPNSVAGGIVADTNNDTHAISRISLLSANTTYSLSFKAKAGAVAWAATYIRDDDGSPWTYFDLSNGIIGSDSNAYSGISGPDADGYYTCHIVRSIGTVAAQNAVFIYAGEADGDVNFAGDDSSVSIYVKEIMIEELPSGNAIGDDLFDQETTTSRTSGADTVEGTIYRIVSQSTLDFTTVGAPDNDADTVFIATAVDTLGSGDELAEITAPAKGIPDKDPWPALAGGEAITAQNDRDFSSGTVGNWTASADGAGTCAYNTDSIGGRDDKQGLLTSSGDSYLRADLLTSNMSLSTDTLYRVSARLYAPNANTLKSVLLFFDDIAGDIPGSVITTLSGDTWTEVRLYNYFASDIIGKLQIGFYGDPADGDKLYFDDISIRPVQISWVPQGTNTIEIDETEDALKISYVDNLAGAQLLFKNWDLSSNLTVGEEYLVSFDAKVGSGDTVTARIFDGANYVAITQNIAESWTTYKMIFTAGTVDTCLINFAYMGSGEVVYIRNLSLKAVPDSSLLAPSDYVNSATIPAKARFESAGLLVEGEATNLLLYGRDLTNDLWVKTNVTATKDQIGVDGVASSASKLAATAADGTAFLTVPTVQPSGAHTTPVWVKRITGSGAVYLSDDNGANYTEITLTTSWTRFEIERTQTQPIVGFKIAVSGDEIAVDFGQVEYSSIATSAIVTTASQATRTSEAADGTYGYMWAVSAAIQAALADTGTLVVEWTPKFSAADGSGNICLLTFEPSATGLLYYDCDNTDFEASDSTNTVTVAKSIVKDTTYTLVVRWHKANDALVISVKDGSTWTHGTAGAFDDSIPHTGNKLHLHYGSEYPANFKNLYLFDIYLTDAEVEAAAWLDAQGLLSAAITSAKPSMAFTAR